MLIRFAVKDFIADKKYNNLSQKTIDGYESALSMFQDYCAENQILNVEDISTVTLKNFLMSLQNEKMNNVTSRNNKLRILKNFYNWLQENEIITEKQNIAKKVKYAKEDIILKPFTDQQIQQMLAYLRRRKERYLSFPIVRDYKIVIFLLGTGVRLGELINLKWNDLDLINGSASIIGKKRELSSIPLTEKLCKELAEYKLLCEQHFDKLCPYVFCTQTNEKMKPDTVKTIFKRLKRIMNFDTRLSCHTFRITFAVKCIQNGIDSFTLQKLLRHTDISMTSRYVRMFGTALKDVADRHNPLNNIDI